MRHKSNPPGTPASPSASERLVRDIRRFTRKQYSAEFGDCDLATQPTKDDADFFFG